MKRVLLDENLPKGLVRKLGSEHTSTVHKEGWAGISNGELLTRAAGSFDVLLTADQNLQYQQNLKNAKVGVILLHAASTRLSDLEPLLPEVLDAIEMIKPGELLKVGG